MSKEFIQVTCTKANGDFIICSNLGLMDHQKMSPTRALQELRLIAERAQMDGFTVEWIVETMTEQELEFYGDLFVVAD